MIDVLIWLAILAITGGTIKWMVGEDDQRDDHAYHYYQQPAHYAVSYREEEDVDNVLWPYNRLVPEQRGTDRENAVSTGMNLRYYRFDRRTGKLQYSDEE